MISIKHNLQQVHSNIDDIARKCGRNKEEIVLLAVSKNKPIKMIEEAIAEGQLLFGENYVQEGIKKVNQLNIYPNLEWHFIGSLQSNKSRLVAENFTWCHTIDRFKIAQRLNNQRPKKLPPLNVLIEVNISNVINKSGILLKDLPKLAEQVLSLPQLSLRGIMAIPAMEQNYQCQLEIYQQMAQAFRSLQKYYPKIDTLSIGMSNDMDAAITAGSTLIRIGTAIFGMRN